MNILRRLREQAKDYDCKICGANHARSDIRLLGRLEAAWIVRVTCWQCETAIKLLVYVDRERASFARMSEPVRVKRPPVSLDEVIDAHEFLERFEGDARALFVGKGKVVGSTET
ncbi:MAG TPA: hypothetical protein VGS01_08315 [Candidatus Limnocylindria bacterium]|nr:hypothetical protein [Candidatus Limnocylindria bacterium]